MHLRRGRGRRGAEDEYLHQALRRFALQSRRAGRDRRRGDENTGYTGTVAVDLIDASASACHTNPGLTTASNLTFVSANAGRKPQSFTLVGKAAPSVRVRIQEGAAAPACSSDSFTIRPQGFSAVSSSANADAAGADAAAVPSVKAGAAFTLRADTGKPGYNGLPKVNSGLLEWLKVRRAAGARLPASVRSPSSTRAV